MKVAVIGSGAMGCMYGGLLAEGGHEVWLIDSWREHVNAMSANGLTFEDWMGRTRSISVYATTQPEAAGAVDLAVVFYKTFQNPLAIEQVRAVAGPNTLVLTLQNGLGNAEALAAVVGPERVLAGVSYRSAGLPGPGWAVEGGQPGETIWCDGDGVLRERTEILAQQFSVAGIAARADRNVRSLIWGKLLVNVGTNASCALTRMTLGGVANHPAASQVVEAVVREAMAVAAAEGVELTYSDPVAHLFEAMRTYATVKPSMLQDIEKGRPTEILAINGAIAWLGEKHGIPTPANQTVTWLVQGLESRAAREGT